MTIDSRFAGSSVSGFLDHFLISSSRQYIMLRDRQILVNGTAVTDKNQLLMEKDIVTVINSPCELSWQDGAAADVIWCNDAVYFVSKPAGIIIHSDDPAQPTLAKQATNWQLQEGIVTPVRYLHRLDKDTSGLVMFCRQPFLQPIYDRMIADKQIRRQYLAITFGKGTVGKKYVFDQPIGRDRHRSGCYRVSASGKDALTEAEIIASDGSHLYWKCDLQTGRTHQIRVHLANAGFPIVNDPLYGKKDPSFANMALWAWKISYQDPLSGEQITVTDRFNEEFAFLRKKGIQL